MERRDAPVGAALALTEILTERGAVAPVRARPCPQARRWVWYHDRAGVAVSGASGVETLFCGPFGWMSLGDT